MFCLGCWLSVNLLGICIQFKCDVCGVWRFVIFRLWVCVFVASDCYLCLGLLVQRIRVFGNVLVTYSWLVQVAIAD